MEQSSNNLLTSPTPPKWKAMAERSTILLGDCGSKGFGLSLPTSDNDLKGVCVEDFSASMSLSGKFEQFIEKVPPTHQYAGHDLVIYSLEKFLRLAMVGNPDVTPLLFSKNPVTITPAGVELQALVPRMIHTGWAKRFLGYMESQRQKLIGERGQKRVTRADLVAEHGWDTKYGYHLLRLGMQGIELMTDGTITMPFTGAKRDHLLAVRGGQVSLNDVLQEAGDLERELKDLMSENQWPEHPDVEYIEEWTREAYMSRWVDDRL